MKVICLVENTTSSDKIGLEHGLSLYIETYNHKILFDMGQTNLFLKNAEVLNVNIADVDIAVLSHGHYDHGGGLKEFLSINNDAFVYVNKDAFNPHYNGTEKYIGLDRSLKNNSRIILTHDKHFIENNLTLYTCNEKKKIFEQIPSGLNEKIGENFLADDFRHEQYLLIEENEKKYLFSGCSHKGILNITEWFKPDVLIGGFHFSKLPIDKNLEDYSNILNGFKTDFYTCHCTGQEQYGFMKNYIPRLSYLSGGQSIVF